MNMFSRAYTSLSRITIEAADCRLNYQNLNGHLTIYVEPIDPVLPTGNRDPLIGQRPRQNIATTTRPNDRIEIDRNNAQPSTSHTQQNAMIADSTHRSPQLPSQIVEPLQLQPSAIPSSNNPPPVASEYEEEDYSQNESENENENENGNGNENEIKQENTGPNTPPNPTPNPTPDPIHMPEKENEFPQEDIPQNENENDIPRTPDPDNPIEDTTDFPNPNFVIPEQDDQPQPGTSNTNSDPNSTSALANFMQSPDFEETMRKMTLQVGESTFNNIAKNPKLVKEWILQVIHKFPGLLDEQTDDTVQFIDTDRGQVRIMQPNPTQNSQPLDQQDYDTSVREVAPNPPLTLQQQEENNDTHTIPSSTSPGIILSENSDDDSSDRDCYIAKVSPGYKQKSLKRTAPPPEVSSPHVILKKIPHKQGTRAYTITQTPDTGHTTTTIRAEIHGQPSTTNTGPEQNTPKRPRLNDNTLQPSTSTGTDTSQNNKDKKHRKYKKEKKKDKDN